MHWELIGYAIAMMFVMFGEPDLAMTQLAIETLTVILFVFVIYRLPKFTVLSSSASRFRDAARGHYGGRIDDRRRPGRHDRPRAVPRFPIFAEHSLSRPRDRTW